MAAGWKKVVLESSANTISQNTSGTATGLSQTLVVGSGGTGATTLADGHILLGNGTDAIQTLDLTSKGSLVVGDGTTDPQALAVGTNDYALVADSNAALGVKWAQISSLAGVNDTTITIAAGTNLGTGGDFTTNQSTSETITPKLHASLSDITSVSGANATTDDGAGSDLVIQGGAGKGVGAGGKIVFKVADGDADTSGDETALNSLATAMEILDNKKVVIEGDLQVKGTTTTVNSTNTEITDQFISLNDAEGATEVDNDAGLVVIGDTKSVAYGYDQSEDRWGILKTGATAAMTSFTPSAYVMNVHTGATVAPVDTDLQQYGNFFAGADGTIYVYSAG